MQDVEVLDPGPEPLKSGLGMLLNLNLYSVRSVNEFHEYVLFLSNVHLNFALYANCFIIVFLISHKSHIVVVFALSIP